MKNSFICLFLFINLALCQDTGYSDSFINIGASSRSVGLGQSVVALPNNIGGYTVNPSATANISQNTFTGLYINQFGMAEFFSFGFNYPTNSSYQLGIYGLNFLVDNIFERPDINNISNLEVRRDSIRTLVAQGFNSFSTRETAIYFNISRNIQKSVNAKWMSNTLPLSIPLGLNIKLIHKDLYQTKGKGIGIDIGGMARMDFKDIFKTEWFDELAVGLSLNNIINTAIYWDSGERDNIPMQLVGGFGYFHTFKHLPVKYNLLWQKNSLYSDENQYGIEVITFDIISIRGGYYLDSLQGGLGLKFKYKQYSIGLDYSFSDHDLGNAHRIGGWISF